MFSSILISGYSGNGFSCVDINECAINNGGCSLAPRVECVNTPGSRTCGPCPAGNITELYKVVHFNFLIASWECSGSVVECLSRDLGVAGSILTSVTALCTLILHTGSTQEDPLTLLKNC